jgi:predicted ATPase/DNA-binding XRE family transcriptional regulator
MKMQEKTTPLDPNQFHQLGKLLRYLRERAHLTQRELATRVDFHYSYISRVEQGDHIPDLATITARFIPALELQDMPEWTNRLIALASQTPSKQAPSSADEKLTILPTVLTPLIGREKETSLLLELMSREEVRLLTIVGPPGVGKTRLALYMAEQLHPQFTNGAAFINLSPVEQPGMMLGAIADTLGVEETSVPSRVLVLKSFLQGKNLLLVLDNFEQILDASPQLIDLLSHSPTIKMIVTSREALRVPGEQEFHLTPLPLPQKSRTDLSEIKSSPAIQLFIQRASAAKSQFQLTEENASHVAEICRRLDGLPLAIELAAARTQSLSLIAMLEQFDRRFDWLTRGRRDTPSWRQTLSGAIEWSHTLLNEPQQILLRRLSIFTGNWTLETAEEICADPVHLPKNKILDLLLQLIDRSLVVVEEDAEQYQYYRFLDTIRHFAQGKLEEAGETSEYRSRHLSYFVEWAKRTETRLDIEALLLLRKSMEREYGNIRSALEWGLQSESQTEMAISLAISMGSIWLRHSHFREALDWVEKYLPFTKQSTKQHAELLHLAQALCYWRDDLPQAINYSQEAETLARGIQDKFLLAKILYYSGDIFRENKQFDIAHRALTECIELFREIPRPVQLSCALTSLGLVLYQLGEKEKSKEFVNEGLQISLQENSLPAQGYALRIQAEGLRFDKNYQESFEAFMRAYAIARAIDDRVSMGMELANLSLLAKVLGDHSNSYEFAKSAYALFQAIGNEYQQPFPLRMMAYALIKNRNFEQAYALCVESLRENHALGHNTGVLACVICLATLELEQGNQEGAMEWMILVQNEIGNLSLSMLEADQKAYEEILAALKPKLSTARASTQTLQEVLRERKLL